MLAHHHYHQHQHLSPGGTVCHHPAEAAYPAARAGCYPAAGGYYTAAPAAASAGGYYTAAAASGSYYPAAAAGGYCPATVVAAHHQPVSFRPTAGPLQQHAIQPQFAAPHAAVPSRGAKFAIRSHTGAP